MDNKRQELNFIIIGWGIGVWIWITFILLHVGEFLLLISFVEFGDRYYKFDIVEYIFYIFYLSIYNLQGVWWDYWVDYWSDKLGWNGFVWIPYLRFVYNF